MAYNFLPGRIAYIFLAIVLFSSHLAWAQVKTQPEGYVHPDAQYAEATLLNQPQPGFRGIWYSNQASTDEYKYKYSGGLGTYTANHNPLGIYVAAVNKTFFCYGGVNEQGSLMHAVSYFDHKKKTIARPIGVVDKNTTDAHDNPVLSIDDQGFIWLFSTSHGVWRPSYIHRSKRPYDITEFEEVKATKMENGERVPLDNFSYLQVYHQPGKGFFGLFTHYVDRELAFGKKNTRIIAWMTSPDGVHWSEWKDLAAIEEGHYQTSTQHKGRIGTSFNYHPNIKDGIGLNYRTNIYFLQTADFGRTWQNASGQTVELPLQEIQNTALVADYTAQGLNVYINDLGFDAQGRPVILYVTSKGYEAGPEKGPREWHIAHWNGTTWDIRYLTASDNNYDMGSLYVESDNNWKIIGPTGQGPQPYNTGGEMAMWVSRDAGATWELKKKLTNQSEYNHSYARRPENAHPGFYAFWADGHGRQPSDSRLYFATKEGTVYRLPVDMKKDHMKLKPFKR